MGISICCLNVLQRTLQYREKHSKLKAGTDIDSVVQICSQPKVIVSQTKPMDNLLLKDWPSFKSKDIIKRSLRAKLICQDICLLEVKLHKLYNHDKFLPKIPLLIQILKKVNRTLMASPRKLQEININSIVLKGIQFWIMAKICWIRLSLSWETRIRKIIRVHFLFLNLKG